MSDSESARTRPRAWLDVAFRLAHPVRRLLRPVSPSPQTGMGANTHDQGTAFRVWAPHADQVKVTGSFNGWSQTRTPLAREADGSWSADVPQARPGNEYKFVISHGGKTLLRTDPYARAVSFPYQNGIIPGPRGFKVPTQAGPASPFHPPERKDLVIYELHVGTFNRKQGEQVGTFAGVIEKLPYLYALGVNAIELMPVAEFASEYSWGYNPAHPFSVARAYGGAEGLRQLVRAAHIYGIAVIVDVVYNHFGPDNLSLWQFDGWHEHGKGGIYFYNDWRSKTPWADTRPDYGRPEVRRYIRDNALMWLEEYLVDGLRLDATSYIRNAHGRDGDPGGDIPEGWRLLQEINDEINDRFQGKTVIAEDMQGNEWLTRPTSSGGAGFHGQWDARFVHTLRSAVIPAIDAHRDMFALCDAIDFRFNSDAFQRVIYSESHDEVANGRARIPEDIAPGNAAGPFAKKRASLAAVIVLTAPGIPMIFQGQEFLEDGWFDDRVSLDWNKMGRRPGILHLYRHLIRLRRNEDGTTRGLSGQHTNVFHVDNTRKLIAFHRWDQGGPGDDVIVVANFANQSVEHLQLGFPRPGPWRVRFNSDQRQYDPTFKDHRVRPVTAVKGAVDGMPYQATLTLGPYSAAIFSQDSVTS